jgi:uncharacterized protein involved in outer membrane biogenesis
VVRRRSTLFAAAGAGLVLAAVVAFVFVQDPQRYREEVVALLAGTTGHPVAVGGELTLRWQPSPALTVREVSVDVPGARVSVDRVQVALDSRALMLRRLRAREIVAEGVRVHLDGAGARAALTVVPDPAALPVRRLTLRDLRVLDDGRERVHVVRAAVQETTHPDGPRIELESVLPRMRGRARLARREGALALRQVDVDTPVGTVTGELTLSPGDERPRLAARLRANALDMAPFVPAPATDTLFPQRVLDPGFLNGLDVEARVEVGRLSVGDWRLSQVETPLQIRDGRLELSAAAVLAGGSLSASFTLETGGAAPRTALDVELRRADAGATLIMAGLHGAERGGRLDLSARLEARGVDTRGLLGGLQGRARIDARDFTFRASAAEIAASDVYAALMRVLRGEEGSRIGLECAVARLEVDGGVVRAARSLGLQSRAVNVLGTAHVSLADQQIGLVLRPWPRPGLGPSARAVADGVRLYGDLGAPRVELVDDAVDPGGLPGAGVRDDALTAMERGLRPLAHGDAPCARAMGTRPASVRGDR